jgi:hypothetical protein
MEKLQGIFGKSRNIWILFIAWILFASNLWLPRNWGFYGAGDWDLTYSTFEVSRINIIEYGEWPSYQGFLSFGSDLDANPQSVGASIFLIPILFFGTFYGYKISILLGMLIGLWGAFKLFKLYTPDVLFSIGMAIIFVGAPYFSRHIFEAGHSNFLFFYFLPWIFYQFDLFKRSGSHKSLLFLILLLTLPICGGAPLLTIIASSGLFLLGLGYYFIDKKPIKFLIGLSAAIVFPLILNAWKIFPALELWDQSPRLANDESGINLLIYIQSLCDFTSDTKTPHQWHEFAIGFPMVLFILTLNKLFKINQYKFWVLLFIPIFWIGLGNYPNYVNPWYLLNHNIPIFSSLRAPYRISVLSLLILCVLFIKTSKLYDNKELIFLALLASTIAQTLSFNSISNKMVFTKRYEDMKIDKNLNKLDVIKLKSNELENQFLYVQKQCIVQNAYEPLNLLKVEDSLRAFVEGGDISSFKPNHLKIQTNDSLLKTALRFNKNWSLIGVGQITNHKGLLCVKNTKGDIELVYKNEKTKIGLKTSAFALILLLLILKFTSAFRFKHQ